jgi:hypothetical protein
MFITHSGGGHRSHKTSMQFKFCGASINACLRQGFSANAKLLMLKAHGIGVLGDRSSGLPPVGNDDEFTERLLIFLLADRIHRPQLRQQSID